MSPILGIYASARPPLVAGDYESIATVTVGSGGSGTIDFTNIPGTYQHLQLRAIARSTRTGANNDYYTIQCNSDTGNNYVINHRLQGNGTSATATTDGQGTLMTVTGVATADYTSTFGVTVCDILDYANGNKYKTFRSLAGMDNNGSGQVLLISSLWMSTSAITSLTIKTSNVSYNFSQYTHFALYGCKSA